MDITFFDSKWTKKLTKEEKEKCKKAGIEKTGFYLTWMNNDYLKQVVAGPFETKEAAVDYYFSPNRKL